MTKFLDLQGLQAAWARTKEYVSNALKTSVSDRLGKANGIATLGADSKLTPSQLPTLKTVNGQSVIGSGDIAIDLSLYKVVSALPTTGIETNKIYLVIDPSAPEGNVFKEYIYVNSKWELLGEYKSEIDLTPYATKGWCLQNTGRLNMKPDYDAKSVTIGEVFDKDGDGQNVVIAAATNTEAGVMTAQDRIDLTAVKNWVEGAPKLLDSPDRYPESVKIASRMTVEDIPELINVVLEPADSEQAGVMTAEMYKKLSGIATGATADRALTSEEILSVLN